jgi:polyisoprenoid-binding protein YceI
MNSTATLEPAAQDEVSQVVAGGKLFTIVPEESEAACIVEEEFFSGAVTRFGKKLGLTTTGRTGEIEGEVQLVLGEVPSLISSHFTVNIRALTSDENRRDQFIRERWLESDRFPLAEFTATDMEEFPGEHSEGEEVSFRLVGEMTIREISNPVTFDVTAALNGDTIQGLATSTMRMTDFGFDPPNVGNLFMVADEFMVEVIFTAKES